MDNSKIDFLKKICLLVFFFESAVMLILFFLGLSTEHYMLLAFCSQPLIVLASIFPASKISLKGSALIGMGGIILISISFLRPFSQMPQSNSSSVPPSFPRPSNNEAKHNSSNTVPPAPQMAAPSDQGIKHKVEYKKVFLQANYSKLREALRRGDCNQVKFLVNEFSSQGGIRPSDLPKDIDLTKCK